MEYALIIFMYSSFNSKGDSVATFNVSGFANKELCIEASKELVKEFAGFNFRSSKHICVRTK